MLKIAFLGAGSLTFTRDLVRDVLSFPELQDSTLALMDIDENRLDKSTTIAEEMIKANDLQATVKSTLNRNIVLDNADYVINMIHVGGKEPFRNEIEIPQEYGVNQSVGDTLGPGGVFRAMRTIPTMIDIAHDMEKFCPEAPLLQHTNPMAMVCWAVEEATDIDAYGICHSVQGTAQRIARYVDVPFEELNFWVAGINHMSWFLRIEYDGCDLYPDLHEVMTDPEFYADDVVRFEIMRHFGKFTTESSHHLSEYLPYFRRTDENIARLIEISSFTENKDEFEYSPVCWMPTGQYFKEWSSLEPDEEFDLDEIDLSLERSDEYAAQIIHSIETDEVRRMNLNVPNKGTISNLPDGALVEIPCLVDGTGIHGCAVGNLPSQLAELNRTNINVQELAVRASLDCDEDSLRQAVKLDPLTSAVCTLDEIDELVDDLLNANAEYLPNWLKSQ